MIGKEIQPQGKRVLGIVTPFTIACGFVFAFLAGPGPGPLSAGGRSTSAIAAAKFMGVKVSSEGDLCHVMVELQGRVNYRVGVLKNPERLYVDLLQTTVDPNVQSRAIPVEDDLIRDIRVGNNQSSVIRVVVDLKQSAKYRVLENAALPGLMIELDRAARSAAAPTAHPFSVLPTGSAQLASFVTAAEGSQPTVSDEISAQAQSSTPPAPAGRAEAGLITPPIKKSSADDADDATPAPQQNPGPASYGSGDAPVIYGASLAARNVLTAGLNFQTNYNDNLYGTAQNQVGDESFLVGSNVNLDRETKKISLALNYAPGFQIDRLDSSLNTTNQSLSFDVAFRPDGRWTIRARATGFYTNGIFQTNNIGQFTPDSTSGLGLNETLFTPATLQYGESVRLDTGYHFGVRDSLAVYGSFSNRRFGQPPTATENLFNTREMDGGLVYSHRFSPHDTFGLNYTFVYNNFAPGENSRVQSASASYGKQLTASVTVDAHGGPEVSCQSSYGIVPGQISSSPAVGCQRQWSWSAGGDLSKRINKNIFSLFGQRGVSDGAGLLGSVINVSGGGSFSRQLGSTWNIGLAASYAENTAFGVGSSAAAFQTVTGSFSLGHSLGESLNVSTGYNLVRQTQNSGEVLLGNVHFNQNIAYIRLNYRFKEVPLGR